MNTKNRFSNIWAILMVAFCSMFIFTTCSKDELNTNSLGSKETTLAAYGPNPALRGQKLTFAGTRLDKIAKVILPENIEITDIEVVSDKVIRIVIPQETVEGTVKLIGPDNLELIPKNPLTISEPISIISMSPQPVKAGQTLTIEGDYFNFMTKVIFTEKVEVLKADCKSWSRTKIEVVLPAEAAPGVITLADDAEIPLEYQSPEPLQVVLPSVNAVLDLTGYKPGDAITAPGKDLDLVVRVEMPNGLETPFTVKDGTLQFTLAENVSDGAIVMIPASGVKVVVANIGVAMPGEIVVTPDKDLRAGDVITITGINMELVTSVSFTNGGTVEPISQSAAEITVTMPDMAITGEIVLNTASGMTVTAEIETLKPEVIAYHPTPASAGSDLILEGRHLDLAVSVTFAEKLVVPAESTIANELVVGIPLNAVTGVVVLTMANGETVECDELEITEPEFAYLPNPPGSKTEIYASKVFALEIGNGDKLTDVQINGVSTLFIVHEQHVYILIPGNAKGDVELKLVSTNGEAVYAIPVIGMGITETIVWEGLYEVAWDGALGLLKEVFETVPAGARMRFYFAPAKSDAQICVMDGDWGKFAFPDDPNYSTQWEVIDIPEELTAYEVELRADILEIVRIKGMLFGGGSLILSRISIIVGEDDLPRLGLAIYDNGYQEGFKYGWWLGTAPDPENTDVVFRLRDYSLAVTFDGSWSGAYILVDEKVDISSYSTFYFSVYGGTGTSGQQIGISFDAGEEAIDNTPFNIEEGEWVEYSVPVSTWPCLSGGSIVAVQLQDWGFPASAKVYIGRMGFMK